MASPLLPDTQSYLCATYVGKGHEETVPGGVQCYIVGRSPHDGPCRGVVLLPDIRGFQGGRIRAVADFLARYTADIVLVPKLLAPPLDRGTQGDGVPEDFDDVDQQDRLHAWLRLLPWKECVDHKIHSLLVHLKALGASKIALVGCGVGGLLATLAAATNPTVSCLCLISPSLHLLELLLGGPSPEALAARVSSPVLLLSARDDSRTYWPGGTVTDTFRQRNLESRSEPFAEMRRGFVLHGELHNATVHRDVRQALELAVVFLKEHFRKPPKLRLTYFSIPGRAEMTRLTLIVGGVAFEDRRVTRGQWEEMKSRGDVTVQQLPMLEVDGHKLCQSKAIVRYAGRLTGLYPSDPFLGAEVDMVLDMLFDRLQLFTPTVSIENPLAAATSRQTVLKSDGFCRLTGFFEDRLCHSASGFLVGGRLTVADIALYADHSALCGGWLDGIDEKLLEPYPNLQRHRNFIASLPAIKVHYVKVQGDSLRAKFKPDPIVIGYWSIQGLGAGLRMMAMYAGAPIRVENFKLTEKPEEEGGGFSGKEWFTEKAAMKLRNPLSNLPFLIDGELVICQSNACYAYLGRKFGLWGDTPLEQILCEELLGELSDLKSLNSAFVYGQHDDVLGAAAQLLAKLTHKNGILPKIDATLRESTEKGGAGAFLLGTHASAPDFALWTILHQLQVMARVFDLPSPSSTFPHLDVFMRLFAAQPENSKYLDSPLHTQLPFNNKTACFGSAPDGATFHPGMPAPFDQLSG
eukprot:CAMPEP_0118997144 /NCGR_PEP_ID=MMETSP1173-20130426/61256_1 /TAXON_ID=1034831 /ORGANISM="Rhizochromulina marina cf, Strain CCMP1243" /LENGTH=746 /DNA_ID=CAMNT_0006948567 /DNA_START=93 /DNA_END=2330 /DNA_ORIENTATION=+